MNYAEMSDVEINCKVALALGAKDLGDGLFLGEDRRYDIGEKVSGKFKFDPCNSWADAGPIIQENGITVACFKSSQSTAYNSAKGIYLGEIFNNPNPLRAAMIVFLMMKGGE